MGLPPHAYRIQPRVRRARSLPTEGRSLSEVARTVGFYDRAHVTRAFKRYVTRGSSRSPARPDARPEGAFRDSGPGARGRSRAGCRPGTGQPAGWSWVEQWMPPPPEAMVSIWIGTISRSGKWSFMISWAWPSALWSPNSGR